MHPTLNAAQIQAALDALAPRVLADAALRDAPARGLAIVGIRSRGVALAERLAAAIQKLPGRPGQSNGPAIDLGKLDITMYRDDLDTRGGIIIPQGTEMNFQLDDKVVVLTDDVLFTGRSARAALDALVDFGRPKVIRLLALVDRGGREYPIAADYVGVKLEAVTPGQRVSVRLKPIDDEDAVYVDERR